jgi:hypothetical protein
MASFNENTTESFYGFSYREYDRKFRVGQVINFGQLNYTPNEWRRLIFSENMQYNEQVRQDADALLQEFEFLIPVEDPEFGETIFSTRFECTFGIFLTRSECDFLFQAL